MKRAELRELLDRAGIRPSKGKGQNFLVEDSLAEAIVRDAGVDGDAVVWEVGTGLCVLTLPLARAAREVLTVELDGQVAELARELLAEHPNVTLLEGDVLAGKQSLNPEVLAALRARADRGRLLFVANLPYAIATPLLIRALAADLPALCSVVVMVQFEMAERAVAQPGSSAYGAVSVLLQALTAQAQIVRKVPREVFHPRPRVQSAILKLTPCAERVKGFAELEPVVRAVFNFRRKSLANAAKHAGARDPELAWLPEAVLASGLDPQVRVDRLDVQAFRRLLAAR
ncbi:MAG: ribosomal RNA small subunit methyltransferase A [Planctomycetes bacterium]|nr:ribosomal RNA small subunit methyltransferase A [Planctomycetota bacterium]